LLLPEHFLPVYRSTMRDITTRPPVYDAPTIVTVVLMLASVTLIAVIVPTLRIAGIDPATTLRDE